MITAIKTVKAHANALYWKNRMEKAEAHMRRNLKTLSENGSGKWETEHGVFVVSENNTYPADAIRASLSDAEIDLCMEKKWSNARAKVLFPAAYHAARVNAGYKVSL